MGNELKIREEDEASGKARWCWHEAETTRSQSEKRRPEKYFTQDLNSVDSCMITGSTEIVWGVKETFGEAEL